jgi:hypothetical protein
MSEVKKIIRFKDDTSKEVMDQTEEDIKKLGGRVTDKLTLTSKVFICSLPANAVTTTLNAKEHVEAIEDDSEVKTQ